MEIPLTEENGKDIPTGTTFESGTPGITVDDKGKVTVTIPKEAKPGNKITGKVTVTYPDGSKEEVPVKVTNSNGSMATGWLLDNGSWYYLNSNGDMKVSQWFQVSGKWYYVDESGMLAVNTTVNGYRVNANGELVN
ncbi:choline binding protein [Streptococcus pseudopneumoniae IS7493]|nr:choline binding protein [Streptococcus pseudopneumoniae IS7493]